MSSASRTAAGVRLVAAGFQTSSALAAVSGRLKVEVPPLPGREMFGVRLPLVWVVPFR